MTAVAKTPGRRPKEAGFIVGQQIATHAKDDVAPDGTLIVNQIDIALTVKYPQGLDLKPYKAQIERAIVEIMPNAYMELERRSQ